MERIFNSDILDLIKTRWSSRAVSGESVPRETVLTVIEAARYAPSCFNEQPWHFIIADAPESLDAFRETLSANNRVWADKAPILILVASRKKFAMNGADNFWYQFDAGTAWGYLSLEAERQGLVAHAMGGFDRDAAAKAADLPSDYEALAMIAVGKPGNSDDLPDAVKEREIPGTRNDIGSISSFGKFKR